MHRRAFLFISPSVFEIWNPQPLFSGEATLEDYSVSHGGQRRHRYPAFLQGYLTSILETAPQGIR